MYVASLLLLLLTTEICTLPMFSASRTRRQPKQEQEKQVVVGGGGSSIVSLFGRNKQESQVFPNKLAVGSAVAPCYAQWRRVVQNRVCLPAFLQSFNQSSAVHTRRRDLEGQE